MKKSIKRTLLSVINLILLGLILYVYANQSTSIPILLYHHVNYTDKDSLSVTPENFEEQMKYLFENDYKTLFLDEFYSIIKQGRKIPAKSVIITFDDGYLDNWVYAYPILKKYKMKATIFVITSYIKNSKKYRANLEDVWRGRDRKQDLPKFPEHNEVNFFSYTHQDESYKYFLTWEEMRRMTDSGLIDIESHSHSHSSFFTSNKIIDFNHENYWALATCTNGDMRIGIPVYEQMSGLTAIRFFDDKKLRDFIAEYINKNGGEDFFKKNKDNYKKILNNEVENYRKTHKINEYYETKEEAIQRITKELELSRRLIRKNLFKPTLFIAWPWGKYNEQSLTYAKNAGYIGTLSTKKGSNKINLNTDFWQLKRVKVWPRGNWWFGIRLNVYSNEPLADFFSLFTD